MTVVAGRPLSLLGYSVPTVALMVVVTRGFAYGMSKPSADALYTRVPRETRYQGKNFLETAVWRFGDFLVTSVVSGLHGFGAGIARLGLLGTTVAVAGTAVARRAGWASDLAAVRPAPIDQQTVVEQ